MLRFLIFFISAITVLAQVPPKAQAQTPPKAQAQTPPKAQATDAQIEAQLHDRLAKSVVGKDGFTAKVKGGVVYWEGSTAIAQHKGAATRMAKSSGARRVVNNIKVKKAGGPPAPVKQAGGPPAPPKAAVPVVPEPGPAAAIPALKRVTVQWRELRH